MNYSHYFHVIADDPVQDQVSADYEISEFCRQVGPSRAKFWERRQAVTGPVQTIEERVGCANIAGCDAEPDLDEIVFGASSADRARHAGR